MHYLLLEKSVAKVYGPIEENKLRETTRFFKGQGFKVTVIPEPPLIEVLRQWQIINQGQCIDGCVTDGWESCEHGSQSWLRIFKKELS